MGDGVAGSAAGRMPSARNLPGTSASCATCADGVLRATIADHACSVASAPGVLPGVPFGGVPTTITGKPARA